MQSKRLPLLVLSSTAAFVLLALTLGVLSISPARAQAPAVQPAAPGAVSFTSVISPVVPGGIGDGSAAWGDYDNDGRLDLLFAGYLYNPDTLSCDLPTAQVYRNTGSGSFTLAHTLTTDWVGTGQAAWGDYDNDGRLDIAISGYVDPNSVTRIFRNTGSGFTEAQTLIGLDVMALAWGDADNDGRADLLVGGFPSSGPGRVWVYRNTGTTFTQAITLTADDASSSLAWGDYDNDGRLDVLLVSDGEGGSGTAVYRNTGVGFSQTFTPTNLAYGSAAWGDYDGDGKLDFVINGASGGVPQTLVYRNTGSGFAQTSDSLAGLSDGSAAWGDYDNDGDLDLALTGFDYDTVPVTIIYNYTGGSFVSAGLTLTPTANGSAAWGDYDNDRDLDLLLAGCADGFACGSPLSQLYRNDGAPANTPPTAPTGLNTNVTGNTVTFSWNAASDDHTPANGLSYNLVVTPTAGLPYRATGRNGPTAFLTLPDGSYTWRVQAVDGALQTGNWAAAASFTVGTPPCQLTVSTTADSGPGSLRAAVACADPGATITFAPAMSGQTITFASDIVLNKNLTIRGAVPVTLSGNNATRLFRVTADVTVTLNSLTLTNGKYDRDGGAIHNRGALTVQNSTVSGNSADFGGGIFNNDGTLTVQNSTFSGNSARGAGGGIASTGGTLTVQNSTFSGNSAISGGGIKNLGTLTVQNSTFSGNSAYWGGGISNAGTLTVQSSTFSGNSADDGGGIDNLGTLTVQSSVFSQNGNGNCAHNPVKSNGYNVSSDATCGFGGVNDRNNVGAQTGALQPNGAAPLLADSIAIGNVTDAALCASPDQLGNSRLPAPCDSGAVEFTSTPVAKLQVTLRASADRPYPGQPDFKFTVMVQNIGTAAAQNLSLGLPLPTGLAYNGAPTWTGGAGCVWSAPNLLTCTTLAAGSSLVLSAPATVSAAPNTTLNVTAAASASGVPSASGAFPVITAAPPVIPACRIVVKNANDSGPGSLRQAVADATPGCAILFSRTLKGQTITLQNEIVLNKNLTISGLDYGGNDQAAALSQPFATVGWLGLAPLLGLLWVGQRKTGRKVARFGSALAGSLLLGLLLGACANVPVKIIISGNNATRLFTVHPAATVTLTGLTFANGKSNRDGGAIYNNGTLTVQNSTFSGNSADDGGGIANWGTLTVQNSTFSGNSAAFGGGGIANQGALTVQNSTFSGNSADWGGGIDNLSGGTLTVQNSTFSGNSAHLGGGGISNWGALTVENSTFSGNSARISRIFGGISNIGTLTVQHSVLQDGTPVGNGTGNVFTDPTFVRNPGTNGKTDYGDLHLQKGSPAIGLGQACLNTDLEGATRPTNNCSAGAYEYSAATAGTGGLAFLAPQQAQNVYVFANRAGDVTLEVPAGAVTQTVELAFSLGQPVVNGAGRALGVVFTPYDGSGNPLAADFTFQKALTLTLEYSPSLVTNGLERDLLPVRFDPLSAQWEPFTADVVVDKVARTVTFPILQPGEYGLFSAAPAVYAAFSAFTPAGVNHLPGGAVVTYTLTALSTTLQPVTDLVITHTLPAGLTFVDWVDANGAQYSGGSITWNINSVAGYGQQSAVFTAQVSSAAQYQGQTLTSLASLSGPGDIRASAQAAISVNAPVAPADDDFTTRPLTAVTVYPLANDENPDGSPLALTAPGAPAHGAAAIVGSTVVYTPTTPGEFSDSFSYTVQDGAFTRTATIHVRVALLAFLEVFKTVEYNGVQSISLPAVPKGSVVTYTLTLYNAPGGEIAQSAALSDTLPAGVAFTSWITQAGATLTDGVIHWSAATAPTDTRVTIRFRATVTGDYGAVVTNTVGADAANADPVTARAIFAVMQPYRIFLPLVKR